MPVLELVDAAAVLVGPHVVWLASVATERTDWVGLLVHQLVQSRLFDIGDILHVVGWDSRCGACLVSCLVISVLVNVTDLEGLSDSDQGSGREKFLHCFLL